MGTSRSPKLKGQPYGAYVLGVRGSSWALKAGSEPLVMSAGVLPDPLPAALGKPLGKEELEASPLIRPESRVLAVTPFVVQPVNGIGLQLRASDGSALLILPTAPEADDLEGALPELADWELLSPGGLLSAGPGVKWSFEPSAGPTARTMG